VDIAAALSSADDATLQGVLEELSIPARSGGVEGSWARVARAPDHPCEVGRAAGSGADLSCWGMQGTLRADGPFVSVGQGATLERKGGVRKRLPGSKKLVVPGDRMELVVPA